MSLNAAYASTPRYLQAVCDTPNTNYDGTGTIVELGTGAENGTRIDGIGWAAQGSVADAGRLNIFMRLSNTDTWRFVAGFEVPAITVSVTQPPVGGGWGNIALILPYGAQIGIAATVAGTFMVHCPFAGDF